MPQNTNLWFDKHRCGPVLMSGQFGRRTAPMRTNLKILSAILIISGLVGCSPEIGSKAWCADMKEKPKGEWTANEAADFAKNCLI